MIDEEKMTSDRIVKLLENKHSGDTWAFFSELRTCTGHLYKPCYIDCYAAGLWEKNRGFIAYEIKVARNDFLKDIQEFNLKQSDAIANSSQFYYVCPQKLIDPSEVPEVCGLMWADAGGVKIKKVAPIREMKGLELSFAAALLRASAGKKVWNPAWKYLGKDMSEQDLLKLAKDLFDTKQEWDIKREVDKRVKEANAEGNAVKALERIVQTLKVTRWGECPWSESVILETCKKIASSDSLICIADSVRRNLSDLELHIGKLKDLCKPPSNDASQVPPKV